MEKFYLEKHLKATEQCMDNEEGSCEKFFRICRQVKERVFREMETKQENMLSSMEIQKKAMIGYQNEVAYMKEKIQHYLCELQIEDTEVPPWYESLIDGIYHENWGLAGIAEWFSPKYGRSSSAKVIGERIYFLEDGVMTLKVQSVSAVRREQLLRTLLLLTPEERMNQPFHEVYLLDGTRVTIFSRMMTKQDQDVIIFRRYVVPRYRFEEQAQRGTIPHRAVPLLEAMTGLGFNVVFTGAVRSAKTTFLATWQSYEDPKLEGVLVETDPEIPLHLLMPEAPIVQLLADGGRLDGIVKNLLRSDADYVIFAEARDGQALDTAVRIASKGTKRMKMTFHTRSPLDFPLDAALEITKFRSVSLELMMKKIASSFDFIFHFVQLKDKGCKRLSSIYQMELNPESQEICMEPICLYDFQRDKWNFFDRISLAKKEYACIENKEAYMCFSGILSELAQKEGEG